jgi:hypothetical protein
MALSDIFQAKNTEELKILFGIDPDETDGKKVGTKAIYTQDFVDIKSIANGMIQTKAGRYLTMLEILPDNILGKPENERELALDNFYQFLRTAPVRMQLKIINKRYSPEAIIADIHDKMDGSSDGFLRLAEAYEDSIRNILTLTSINRRFLLMLEYEYDSTLTKLTDPDLIAESLAGTRQIIKASLRGVVGEVLDVSDRDAGRFYYEYFNPRTSQILDYQDRVGRIFTDTASLEGLECIEDAAPSFDDLFAPADIDLYSKSDHYIMDGMYRSHLILPSNGWRVGEVGAGFLTQFLLLDDGYDVDLYFKRLNVRSLRNTLKLTKKIAQGQSELTKSSDGKKNAARSFYAKDRFSDGLDAGEIPYCVVLVFTITTDTFVSLVSKRSSLERFLSQKGYSGKRLKYNQDIGLLFSAFTMNMSKALVSRGKKEFLSCDLTAAFPFNSYSLNDPKGVVIGVNSRDLSVVRPDILNTHKYGNSNITVLGQAGSGKSFTMQTLAMRYRLMGTQIFAIIPEKSHEWKQACDALEGDFIMLSEGSKDHVNIMDIRPSTSPATEFLDGIDAETVSFLSDKISELVIFFHLIMPHISPEEEKILTSVLMTVYKDYGITLDNNTLYNKHGDVSSGIKLMPIIGDVYDACKGISGLDKVKLNLEPFVSGHAQSFNHRTNKDFSNKYVCASIEKLKGNMLTVGMFILTTIFTGVIKEDRTVRQLLFMDEGAMLLAEGVPDLVSKMVRDAFKLLRGYGGGVVLGTQDLKDLFSKKGGYGEAVLAASAIKIIHYMEYTELIKVKKEIGLSDESVSDISRFHIGEALLIYKNVAIPIEVRASEYEKELINSNPEDAKLYLEQRLKAAAENNNQQATEIKRKGE